ncbi:MEKHLA domain-containing protein [Mariprofundus ferrooxydans]|uniref:MEKHLA domain-containing protein n=1 Tax=Mariprofundus ferrooxydans PV-1 TaxID=314345 RepID=Q0EWW9_9PROT|nr:MEKHLA domain-containing protein [Mariprofundus ferrooxydans]EAU53788.1 hypothetical protein SPV1_10159 [Mariprofundus ferrooxydans PV-1]KON47537.1 MEKHLA domain-containing protein [Mariprofundus ferrooxydans]
MAEWPEPDEQNGFLVEHARLLSDSLQHWSGCGLIEPGEDEVVAARMLYFAPFALLSHGTGSDPLFTYANHTAQALFEMDWAEITRLPSRLSAEAPLQAERNALLKRVSEQGFIDDYTGIRIAASGRRFYIEQATVWSLLDSRQRHCGQAAMFGLWRDVSD